MADYITLLGAEEVSRAANNMGYAATEMQRAASAMQAAVDQQQRFMDDWLSRFDMVVQERTCDILNRLPR